MLTYSVEKLSGRILLENAKALESLQIERAEGCAIVGNVVSQFIVVRQAARFSHGFSHNLIYLQNRRCAEAEFFNRIDPKAPSANDRYREPQIPGLPSEIEHLKPICSPLTVDAAVQCGKFPRIFSSDCAALNRDAAPVQHLSTTPLSSIRSAA